MLNLEKVSIELKKQDMLQYKHIFIIGDIIREDDCYRVDKYQTHYCIKCGLDTTYALSETPYSHLTETQRSMYNIYNKTAKNGIFIEKFVIQI